MRRKNSKNPRNKIQGFRVFVVHTVFFVVYRDAPWHVFTNGCHLPWPRPFWTDVEIILHGCKSQRFPIFAKSLNL